MAKKNPLINWIMWVTALMVGVGVGELFIGGTFFETTLLGWIPDIVHTIVGWVVAIGTVVNQAMNLPK